jgi:hypothetical protein
MTKWAELQKRFMGAVKRAGGPYKFFDGSVSVTYYRDNQIDVALDAYSIGDWSRNTDLGTFFTEEDALAALEAKIIEAEKVVEAYLLLQHGGTNYAKR